MVFDSSKIVDAFFWEYYAWMDLVGEASLETTCIKILLYFWFPWAIFDLKETLSAGKFWKLVTFEVFTEANGCLLVISNDFSNSFYNPSYKNTAWDFPLYKTGSFLFLNFLIDLLKLPILEWNDWSISRILEMAGSLTFTFIVYYLCLYLFKSLSIFSARQIAGRWTLSATCLKPTWKNVIFPDCPLSVVFKIIGL